MNKTKDGDSLLPDMQKVLGQLIPVVYLIGTLVLIAYAIAFWRGGFSSDPNDWGTLGDYFGGLMNPVISFATLIVAYAVWKQQRDELQLTRKALTDQARTAEQQRQEQRFFDLLNLYHATVSSTVFIAKEDELQDKLTSPCQGKQAVREWVSYRLPGDLGLFRDYGWTLGELWNEELGTYRLSVPLLMEQWNQSLIAEQFAPYFRIVFRLLSDAEELLGTQHWHYVKLLRAQLGQSELELLGMNLWLDHEGKKMVPLAEKYGLLKHLPAGFLRDELNASLPLRVFGRKAAETVI